MGSVCPTCCFMFTCNLASMRSQSCKYCCMRSFSTDFDIGLGIISSRWMCYFHLLSSMDRSSTPARRTRAWSKCTPTSRRCSLFAMRRANPTQEMSFCSDDAMARIKERSNTCTTVVPTKWLEPKWLHFLVWAFDSPLHKPIHIISHPLISPSPRVLRV